MAESVHADIEAITHDVAELLRPPRRISVSECAREAVRIENPGGYSGPWDAALTPYMVEPMDMLKSRHHEAVVFVSPARSGKTQALLDGWLTHSVVADPGDMGLYFSTQTLAYDYRKRRLERLHRASPQMRAKLSPRAHDTTIEMVVYRHGMIANLGWPTSSQLAQRDLRYVAMSDYDSFPDDIGGEGSAFSLGKKRIQVAMSAGMALIESSPKREITTDQWTRSGAHEAPPVNGGILMIYNRGDRNRWYWTCIDGCGEQFEAPPLPAYDDLPDPQAAGNTAHVACTHCGQVYRPADKSRLNASGKWHPEDWQTDNPRKSSIASYWLLGCAAAFQSWQSLVVNHVMAKREADASGDETALKSTANVDQGVPYRPKRLDAFSGISALQQRQEPDAVRREVPTAARVLLAAVDVQANRFEVAVWAYGIARERWLIDRYAIRETEDGDSIRPASFVEHWHTIERRVIEKAYHIKDSDQFLRVYRVAVDLGGYHERSRGADSTRRAYEWWRMIRKAGLGNRVRLIKGERTKRAKTVIESFPDSTARSARSAGSRGDVPVLLINTDRMKDSAHADLTRETPGPGYVHLPGWLDREYLDELTTEAADIKGHWEPRRGRRNETWDLLIYCDALWHYLGGNKINWERPPAWAAPLAINTESISEGQRIAIKAARRKRKLPSGMAPDGWVL
jgi:phage terminase large subunit GpA-like protein